MPNTVTATLILFCFIILIIVFCVALIKLYIGKIKTYKQKEIDFQKTLNTTIMETQEQVLDNISQDLHDDIGQQLTYINLQIENLKLDSPELTQQLQPLTKSVGTLSESIRSISHSLSNQLITRQDLLKAIQAETQRLNKHKATKFEYIVSGNHDIVFNPDEKIVIYRIFQEIVNNILKHARASTVNINIQAMPFEMKISDNGKGFNLELATAQNSSIGLQSITRRATLIGYEIDINSEPGKGTTVILSAYKNH